MGDPTLAKEYLDKDLDSYMSESQDGAATNGTSDAATTTTTTAEAKA